MKRVFWIALVVAIITLAYGLNLWRHVNSKYYIQKSDFEINDNRSPDEPSAVQSVLAEMGCKTDAQCLCSYRKLLATSSRVERALVAFEGDAWLLLVLGGSSELMLFNSLRSFGLSDDEISEQRENGRRRYLEAVRTCI